MKLSKTLLVLALAVAVAAPAYAQTQNVKISGSIDAYGFYRNNYDLRKNDSGQVAAGTAVQGADHAASAVHRSDADSYFRTNTQLQVAADLSDNVSTVVSVVNQRDWNADLVGATTANTTEEFDLGLDLAYVQMKEIFYSPLTLTVGRQDIWLGRGFLTGNNSAAWDPQATTIADEYSVTTAFDAIRATLDFNPWTVDLVYSKVNENSHDPEDDRDLYVAYLTYKFSQHNAVADLYLMDDADGGRAGIVGTNSGIETTYVFGGRLQFDPISQLTLGAELAYQFGDYAQSTGAAKRDRAAWGLDVFGTYRLEDAWKSEVTLEFVSLSGDDGRNTSGEYQGWNSLYRGKFWTAIEDFREVVFATGDANDQAGSTNVEMIQLKGTIKPLNDLALDGVLSFFWNEEGIATGGVGGSTRNKDIGWETDLVATYDYTEDVSFGLLAGWFIPGTSYSGGGNDATATDLVSSMKVSF